MSLKGILLNYFVPSYFFPQTLTIITKKVAGLLGPTKVDIRELYCLDVARCKAVKTMVTGTNSLQVIRRSFPRGIFQLDNRKKQIRLEGLEGEKSLGGV